MKPLFATDLPAFAADARCARISVEPAHVTALCQGEVLAASSCVMRLDTPEGPVYFFPRADVSAEIQPGVRMSGSGAQALFVRSHRGAMRMIAYTAQNAAGDRVAFDPGVVEIVATPSGAHQNCLMA